MIIPGASSLGRGFDIFGRISNQDALLSPLIEMRSTDRVETVDDVEFDIPVYANVDRNANSDGTARFFSTRRAFETHFAAEASIEASYGLFSAEFSAAYTSDRKVEESSSFALYDVKDTRYTLSLSDSTYNQLKEDVRPAFDALPTTFQAENSEVFWQFFSRFGTHYTTQVELGGRLFYYATISKSYTSDASTANAKMKAEYAGTFGGKAEASAAWSQADEKWMENREVHLKVTGGSSNVLGSLVPTRNVNKGEVFKDWLESIKRTPSVMRYKLRPISELAPSTHVRALDDAFHTFAGAKVQAHSESNGMWNAVSNIFVMGRPVMPPQPTENLPSMQLVVLDSKTLNPLQNKRFYVRANATSRHKSDFNIGEFNKVYKEIYETLKPYKDANHIVILAASNMLGWTTPSSDLSLFLKGCGAGRQLDIWKEYTTATSTNTAINYALIGNIGAGPGQGFEHLEVPTSSNMFPPPLTINARLIPLRANNAVQFKPVGGGREQLTMVAL